MLINYPDLEGNLNYPDLETVKVARNEGGAWLVQVRLSRELIRSLSCNSSSKLRCAQAATWVQ